MAAAEEKINPELFSLFELEDPGNFSITPMACQILAAIMIIAKLSFWINLNKPFMESIIEAFDQFKSQDYAQNLKACITPESMPPDNEASKLVSFLYKQITNI